MLDLHSIGGLVPLLGYLKNSNAGIRAKAAEVVTTVVRLKQGDQLEIFHLIGFCVTFSCPLLGFFRCLGEVGKKWIYNLANTPH